MNSEIIKSVTYERQNVTPRFVFTACIVICFFAILISFVSYYFIRSYNLNEASVMTQDKLIGAVYKDLDFSSLNGSREKLVNLSAKIKVVSGAKTVILFDKDHNLVWSTLATKYNKNEPVTSVNASKILTLDLPLFSWEAWRQIIRNDYSLVTQQVPILSKTNQQIGTAQLAMDVSFFLKNASFISLVLFVLICISCLLVFFFLFRSLKKVIKVLDKQEEILNENVDNLSALFESNKKMKESIQTASARAVELNEQFLRRLGADLHDGPAQMIGYANMRMNNIAAKDAAKDLGHEFQSVKQALEDSLDEIRGISSGLVLPELESMTLKKCLRKVISIHGMNSNAKVIENFVDIPSNVPLPIKICAYRFVQEGLNNAEQHGNAKKCRLTVRYSKGKLYVSLKDNGEGFRTSILEKDSSRLGLVGLKDRIESIGGKFTINSELGVGTAIKFSVVC